MLTNKSECSRIIMEFHERKAIMIITFFGHSDFVRTDEYEQKLLSVLEERVGNSPADMYLGGYGNFDSFALECCKKYKQTHPNITLIFVTPYLNASYQLNHLNFLKTVYDTIIYPEIENKPPKFAISHRNKYMAENADLVICYITRTRGGAYSAYKYAERKGKEIFNLI